MDGSYKLVKKGNEVKALDEMYVYDNNLPRMTVWRILKVHQLFEYHVERVLNLQPADFPWRERLLLTAFLVN